MKTLRWKWLLGLIFIIVMLVVCQNGHADAGVVRHMWGGGDNSDGLTWTTAYNTNAAMKADISGVDTIFVSTGRFSDKSDNYALMLPAGITVKRATVANHGSATGWEDSLGAGTTIFENNALTIGRGIFYGDGNGIVIDGSYRTDDSTGYGLKFTFANFDTANACYALFFGGGNNHTVRYCEIEGNGIWGTTTDSGLGGIIFQTAAATGSTIEYNYIHDTDANHLQLAGGKSNFTIRYNYFKRRQGNAHGEAIHMLTGANTTANIDILYNRFQDIAGTACIFTSGAATISGVDYIGNTFVSTNNAYSEFGEEGFYNTNNCIAYKSDVVSCTDVRIINNSFYGYGSISLNGGIDVTNAVSGCIAENNVFFETGVNDNLGTFNSHDYNFTNNTAASDSIKNEANGGVPISNPFTNFILCLPANSIPPRNSGKNQDTILTVDRRDTLFVVDSWTVGALAFGGEAPPAGRPHLDKIFMVMDSYVGASPDSIPKTDIADSILSGDTAVLGEDIKTTSTIDFPEGDVLLQSKINSIFKISVEQDLSSFTYVPGEVQYSDSLDSGADNRDSNLRHGVGFFLLTAGSLMGYNDTPRDGNMQFQMNIAQGATIDEAFLLLYNDRAFTETLNLKIGAHDQDNAAVLTDSTDFNTGIANFTTAQIDWDGDVTNDAFIQSPEIKTVVQEIVDRGSWVANNWISLYVIDDGTIGTKYIESYQYDNETLYPKLYITWTEGGGNSYAGKTVAEPRQVFLNGVLGVKQVTTDSLYDESPNWVYDDGKVKIFPGDTTGVHITGFAPAITVTDSMLVRNIAVENATIGFTFTGALNKLHNVFLDSMTVGFSLPSGSLEIANDFFTANVDTAGSVAVVDSLTALKLYSVNDNYTEAGVEGALSDIATSVVTSGADLDADYTPNSGSTTIDAGTNTTDGLEVYIRDLGPREFQRLLALTSFTGGGTYSVGTSYPITWTSTGVDSIQIEYTSDELSYNNVIVSLSAALGTYNWTIPNDASTTCKVRITDVDDGSVSDESSSVFTIVSAITDTRFNGQGRFEGSEPFNGQGRWNGVSTW